MMMMTIMIVFCTYKWFYFHLIEKVHWYWIDSAYLRYTCVLFNRKRIPTWGIPMCYWTENSYLKHTYMLLNREYLLVAYLCAICLHFLAVTKGLTVSWAMRNFCWKVVKSKIKMTMWQNLREIDKIQNTFLKCVPNLRCQL